MTAYTSPDNLGYPDDYQQPADSPSAFAMLANGVQTALNNLRTQITGMVLNTLNGTNTDKAPSQAAVKAWKDSIEAREVKAGSGLSGGGTLAATRTLTVDTNTIATRAYADERVVNALGTSTTVAPSQAAVGTAIAAKVVNALGTSTTVAPSQAAVNSGLAGKADSGHTHPFPFRYGRPGTAFPVGADQSTGNISIPHGLGRVPSGALVSPDSDGGASSVFASVESWDGTYIYAQMRNIGAAEAHVYINWLAW